MGDELIADPNDPYPAGVDGPTAPQLDLSDQTTDSDIVSLFIVFVLLANAAILLISLGLMFIGFRGQWVFGGNLILGGLVLVLYMIYRYPRTTSD